MSLSSVESTAREYYNSDDADSFYSTVWGGEDIHIGLYQNEDDSIFDASARTVENMAAHLKNGSSNARVIDLGAGYGGSARVLAKRFGCHVTCLNLSEIQNERNRKLNEEAALDGRITVIDGTFEEIPFENGSFDIVWSQDAILHSGNKHRVIEEVARVMKPGAEFIFTDIMQADDCPPDVLRPILDRIHLDSLGSPSFYRQEAHKLGLDELAFYDMSEQIANHYGKVLARITERDEEIARVCSREYIEKMKVGLGHWVEGGNKQYLKWGIFHFRK